MEASSPAALAGLQPYFDYIVGADQVLQDVRLILKVTHHWYNSHFLYAKCDRVLDFTKSCTHEGSFKK